MDTPRLVLLVVVLVFLFVSPNSQIPSISQQQGLRRLLLDEQQALIISSNTIYDDFNPDENRWINITGLRQQDNYAWSLFPRVKERALEQYRTIATHLSLDEPPQEHNASSASSEELYEHTSVYQNVTGIVRGQWTRSHIADGFVPPSLNLTSIAPHITYSTHDYSRNITGQDGNVRIKLDEKDSDMFLLNNESVREIRAEMMIKDEKSKGDGWEVTLHGIHYPELGGIILATTGQRWCLTWTLIAMWKLIIVRFAGIFALPHFALTPQAFAMAQQLLNRTLNVTIERQAASPDSASLNPWSSSPDRLSDLLFATPHCELIVYLQQHPTGFTKSDLRAIEQELRFPTGQSLPPIPAMRMSALIFSPDCGFVLESKGPPDFVPQQGMHLVGQKLEEYMSSVKHGILAFAMVICAEIFLLMRQMKDASTPSTRSRISFNSIALMALGDGFACMAFMVASLFVNAAFLSLTSTAFLAFLCVSFFSMKFLMDIWTVQAPERLERERNAGLNVAPTPVPRPSDNPAVETGREANMLPLPVTARRETGANATTVILPADQDLPAAEATDVRAAQTPGSARREMGSLYSRFYFFLLGIMFLSLHATTWPTAIRSAYTNILTFSYLSFWVPQIHRNVIRNCRKALRWDFVLGQSILRLSPFLYFYNIEGNTLFIEPDPPTALILTAWVWIQIWALVSQEILGPRFFIPPGWAPPAYDYHPILRDDDQEAGVGILPNSTRGPTQSPSLFNPTNESSSPQGTRTFDCAICMQNLEVAVAPAIGSDGCREGGGGGGTSLAYGIFSRRAYMVTPCRHIFHTECLEGWMRYRLQCPICRDTLPPL